eukprot:1366914-Amphidinium_carterae.2
MGRRLRFLDKRSMVGPSKSVARAHVLATPYETSPDIGQASFSFVGMIERMPVLLIFGRSLILAWPLKSFSFTAGFSRKVAPLQQYHHQVQHLLCTLNLPPALAKQSTRFAGVDPFFNP